MYLCNAFSIQMIHDFPADVRIKKISAEEVKTADFDSAVSHQDTANVLSNILGMNVPMNRINVHLNRGDTLIVAQIMGCRLPEGATTLPEGVNIEFFEINIA
jgi:hypothetical protein